MDFSHFYRSQWLFFDLDDTLWDFFKNSELSLRHVFSTFNEINGAFPSFEEFSEVYHRHNASLWNAFAEGSVTSSLLKTERWRRTLFADADPLEPPEICSVIDREYLHFLSEQPTLVDGAQEMLTNLSKDYMIAVLSNGFIDTQYRKLLFSGLWRFVTRTVVSDEAGFQKPDPRLYEYAVNATGATGTPIMIGDNPATDILGALRAGWCAIWYNPGHKPLPWTDKELRDEGIAPSLFLGSASNMEEVERIIRSTSRRRDLGACR